MASPNTSPSSKNPDFSEIHDLPIVPPEPVVRKEYKEVVPDISVVSDIADNGFQLQNFQKDHCRPQIGSKYFQIQSQLKTDMLSKSNLLLPMPDNLLNRKNNHTSYQQLEIDSCVSQRTNPIFGHNTILPVKIYFDAACPSCITNHAIMTNNGHNGMQHGLPKNKASVMLAIDNQQSDKEMRCTSGNGEVISNKTCCKHVESNVTASLSNKSVTCNHTQLSCTSNSKEPGMSQDVVTTDCLCSKDQHSKLRKSLSKCERHTSDSSLGESKKSEESEKEIIDKNGLKNRNILCPTCWKKTTCTCNLSTKKYIANSSKKSTDSELISEKSSGNEKPHTSSDELSSIWEYLRRQDEKINLIHKKVSSFLSQHESCCINQSAQEKELSNSTESDIPYILNILEVHGDKIRELQDQIIPLNSYEQKSSPANKNKIDESILNKAQIINCSKTETCNEAIHSPCSCNVVCHEQNQKVTKTSTSTMTSFAIENNDKFVYHKQLTVVTDVMKEKKESSSSQPKEHNSPTTKNNLDLKNVNYNSEKKKSHKLNKCSPRLKNKTNTSSSSSEAPDANDNQILKTSHKSERKSKCASAGTKGTDERHNDWAVKERKNSPTQKISALKSHSSKQKSKNSLSPKEVDKMKKSGNKKMIRQISASSSSADSEYGSPKLRQKVSDTVELDSDESEIKSKYGLSSKYLSIATKTYLDKFQLHLDKNKRTDSS